MNESDNTKPAVLARSAPPMPSTASRFTSWSACSFVPAPIETVLFSWIFDSTTGTLMLGSRENDAIWASA